MKYSRWVVSAIFAMLGLFCVTPSVHALSDQIIESVPTDFSDAAPLQITGFMWGSEVDSSTKAFRVLRYVQLYNSSSKPVDLGSWKLTVQGYNATTGLAACELALCPQIDLPGSNEYGYLAPDSHVVIGDPDIVGGAVTDIPHIELEEFVKSKLAVQLVLSSSGYQDTAIQVKPDTALTPHDYFWQRNFSTTGSGYLSTFSYAAFRPESLFNDPLYTVEDTAGLSIVEIYPYNRLECAPLETAYECGDYIKIHVDKDVQNLSSYVVRTDSSSSSRTTSNTFHLSDEMVNDDGYITLQLDDTGKRVALTNSGGYVWIEDMYGLTIYDKTMTQYASAGSREQGFSWVIGSDRKGQWSITPQPYSANLITAPVEEVTTCPTGKYLNPDTGRCRTLEEAVNALAACPEGQERNPTTNRCRAKVTASSASLTPCGEGQERNPATNRCRSIASAVAELIPCDEGYERNPATNRCRKVAGVSTAAAAGSAKLVESAEGGWNMWTWSLVAVAVSGVVGYGIYEWRHELTGFGRRITAKLGKK